jgi:hypothetical protein
LFIGLADSDYIIVFYRLVALCISDFVRVLSVVPLVALEILTVPLVTLEIYVGSKKRFVFSC